MSRIVVVEPHPDDAFLSLGWHLERLWANDEKVIVTVYCDGQREAEGGIYAKLLGASHLSLGLEKSPGMNSGGPIKPEPALREALASLTWDKIVFPLGLQHPDHLRVAATRTQDALRYLDTPYQAKQKLADVLQAKAEGMRIESICFPPKNKWRHAELFKSQAKFFYYNEGLKESKLPEIILSAAT